MIDGHPLRLLIVEDEGLLAMMLCDMVEELGHEVACRAANVEGALSVIASADRALDGCVLDANLGGESAAAVAVALRKAGIPFVVASGYERRELRRIGITEPAISKPYSTEELGRALRTLCRAH